MSMDDKTIFRFTVDINMTENGLKPDVALYDSSVDIGVREGEALERALLDCVGSWVGENVT